MKIIKPGNKMPGEGWSGQFDCTGHGNGNNGCGAILELKDSDLYRNYMSCMGRFETHYISFMCPWCGAETDLMNSDGYRHPDFPKDKDPSDYQKPMRRSVEAAKEHLREHKTYKHPLEFEDA